MLFDFGTHEHREILSRCNGAFNDLPPDKAVYMSHYELASETGIESEDWKKFLTHPQVSEWLSEEIELMKRSQYNKMIQNANNVNRSVGAAQMINALDKSLNKESAADGPAFIYTYVPIAHNQRKAGIIETEDEDIFWRD